MSGYLLVVCLLIVLACLVLALDMKLGHWSEEFMSDFTLGSDTKGNKVLFLDINLPRKGRQRLKVDFVGQKLDYSILNQRVLWVSFFQGRLTGLIYGSKLVIGDEEIVLRPI